MVVGFFYWLQKEEGGVDKTVEKQIERIPDRQDVVVMEDNNYPNICWEANSVTWLFQGIPGLFG